MSFIKDETDARLIHMRPKSAMQSLAAQDDTVGTVKMRIGRFEADYKLSIQQIAILERLQSFYTEQMIEDVLRPIVNQEDSISLRALDWVCTNLSKSQPIVCQDIHGRPFNVHTGYKKALSWFRRRCAPKHGLRPEVGRGRPVTTPFAPRRSPRNFDPFRRRLRIVCRSDNGDVSSTVGQLNYIQFCYVNGVLNYTREHGREIERHMTRVTSESRQKKAADRQAGRQVKRNELSAATRSKLTIYADERTISLS